MAVIWKHLLAVKEKDAKFSGREKQGQKSNDFSWNSLWRVCY